MNDFSVYLHVGRWRWGGKNELEAFSCSLCPKWWSFKCLRSEKIPFLVKYEERLSEMLEDKQARLGRTSLPT